jgi:hypothetical protein
MQSAAREPQPRSNSRQRARFPHHRTMANMAGNRRRRYAMVLCNRLICRLYERSDPNGIRTRVTAVKGRCPGPLDDRVAKAGQYRIEFAARKANWRHCLAPLLGVITRLRASPIRQAQGRLRRGYSLSIKIDNQLCRTSSSAAMLRQNFPGVLHE